MSEDGFDVRTLAVTWRDGRHTHRHRHTWAQLLFARSGVMHVSAQEGVWIVPPTRAIWVPAGVEHAIDVKGEVALRTLYVSAARSGALVRPLQALEVAPLLAELIQHIVGVGLLDPRQPAHDRLAGVLMDLIGEARGVDLLLPMPRDGRAVRLAEQLRTEPGERSGLEILAARAGASLRTLQRLFADETGLTIEAWRQKARLVHSAAALAGGAPVTTAALDCGYDSVSAFIAAFRRQFGVTPGRFARA